MAAEESLMKRDFTRSLGLCVLFLAPSAGAQVLKCTDAEKNVTYSDVPCLRTEKMAVVDTRGQLECHGPQFHQSTKRSPLYARGRSAGLFRVACVAPTLTDIIHSKS